MGRAAPSVNGAGRGRAGRGNAPAARKELPPLIPTAAEQENELALIASLVGPRHRDEISKVRARIGVNDFGVDAHRRLYRNLLVLDAQGKAIDAANLHQQVTYAGEIDDVGHVIFGELAGKANGGYSPAVYAQRVEEQSIARQQRRLFRELAEQAECPTGPPPDMLAEAIEKLGGLARRVAGPAEVDRPVPVGDLLDRNLSLRPVVIDGLLRIGETMNVISSSKVGKSWAVLDLLLAKATGRRWLGSFATDPGPVLLLDNELHPETLTDRIRKVASARGIPLAEIRDRVHVKSLRGQLRDLSQLKRLFGEWGIQAGDYSLVVMDAFYRFLPPGTSENGNADMAGLYNLVDELADTFRTSLALIHHSSKGDQSQKAITDVGAGAGSMARATDTHLVLRPHEDDTACVMDVALRSFPPVPTRCYRWEFPIWTPADDLNPGLLSSPTRRKQEQAVEARARKEGTHLLTHLDKCDPDRLGYGFNRLRRDLGWGLDRINKVVAALTQEGILEAVTVNVNKGKGATTEAPGVRRRTRT